MNTKPRSMWTELLALFLRDEEAVTTAEYAMLMGILVVGSAVVFGQLGYDAGEIARKCSTTLDDAAGMGCYPGG